MPASGELLTQEGTRAARKRAVGVDPKLRKCDSDSH